MKRLFSIVLTAAMLAALLSGCVCETADATIFSDGSGTISARFGFSEAAAERLDLYEELDEEGFAEFTYLSKTYIGDSVEESFTSVSDFNEIFAALNKKATKISAAGDLGNLTLTQSGDDLTLTLVCSSETGNSSAMTAAMKEEVPELTENDISTLLADAVMSYSFTFPQNVRQTSGGSKGIIVKENTVTIDLLACSAGTYRFTTAAETVCDRGISCPLSAFSDLKSDEWYHDGIHYCVSRNMMNGTTATTFEPGKAATRGMIFTILARMDGVTITSSGNNWYADGAAWSVKAGVSDGSKPTSAITRAEFALMLYRFAQYLGYSTGTRADLSGFSDSAKVESWMSDALRWAVGSGVMTGSNGALNPNGNASRAEVATMLFRFCTKIY